MGEVQHDNLLSEQIGSLYLNGNYSDVYLVVEGNHFAAHRAVLASRSAHFRSLFLEDVKELELKEAKVSAFKIFLRYLYSARISLKDLDVETVLDITKLAQKYTVGELESALLQYLKSVLNPENLCTIFDAVHANCSSDFYQFCLEYADRNAGSVLKSDSFPLMSTGSLSLLISRDSFVAPEIDIFGAVQKWIKNNPGLNSESILSHIRLPLIQYSDMLNVVWPSKLISSDVIMSNMKFRLDNEPQIDLSARSCCLLGINVATAQYGAKVIEGVVKGSLLNGDNAMYNRLMGFTGHVIDKMTEGIVVELGSQYLVNHVRLLLWDHDRRSYSYYIEVSLDKRKWLRVIDHTVYFCRSWQNLYFTPKRVKYIRVVGTYNTVNNNFHLVSFEAMFSANPFVIEVGLLVPNKNVATTSNACVIRGSNCGVSGIINGESKSYSSKCGYTWHTIGKTDHCSRKAIIVQFFQPYLIDSIRLLLWDYRGCRYSYFVEVSTDKQHWRLVADKRNDFHKFWQSITFNRTAVTFIRITGIRSSCDKRFCCAQLECSAQNVLADDHSSTNMM